MEHNTFIGTWKLISFQSESEAGEVRHPYGRNAKGFITYTEDGFVSVNIMAEGRRPFSSGDMAMASHIEVESAMNYLAYAGEFRVQGEHVIHRIETSFFPNWVGSEEVRLYDFDRKRLTLSTLPTLYEGEQVTRKLVFERV